MKFFLDTANLDELKKGADWGILDGVTTNPTLIAKEGRPLEEQVRRICDIVDGDISAEVLATETEGMLREGRTLHHDVRGRHGAGKVFLRAAPPGTGIIAGGPMRAVFESLGMQDVVAKSIGSSNPYNMVRATFDALKNVDSPRSVAARRNIKVSALQARRREGADAEATE